MMAAQEYEGMKEQLDLEQNLRVTAETYAHEVTGVAGWIPALVLRRCTWASPQIQTGPVGS